MSVIADARVVIRLSIRQTNCGHGVEVWGAGNAHGPIAPGQSRPHLLYASKLPGKCEYGFSDGVMIIKPFKPSDMRRER